MAGAVAARVIKSHFQELEDAMERDRTSQIGWGCHEECQIEKPARQKFKLKQMATTLKSLYGGTITTRVMVERGGINPGNSRENALIQHLLDSTLVRSGV